MKQTPQLKFQGTVTQMNKILILSCLLLLTLSGCASKDWRTASRESAGIAPAPNVVKEPVMQIYGASAWGWRGWFAIHTWIARQVPELDLDLPFSAIGSGYAH